ncbi:MAG: YerC/YecD family TrpR-related protein [bacterium]|nr:YerC/YecD family TrpR-related protein [bacterium]
MRNPQAKIGSKEREELVSFILNHSKSRNEVEFLLRDLFTLNEVNELVARLQIVKMLKQGMSHSEISHKLHTTRVTISRGAKALNKSKGAFSKL